MQEEVMKKYFLEALNETCEISLSLHPEEDYFDNFDEIEEESVICSIGFTGTLEGTMTVSMPDSSAMKIVSKMLETELDDVNDQVLDGVGEFVNMLIGSTKMKIRDAQQNIEISLPTYIKGSRMVVLSNISNSKSISGTYKMEEEDIRYAVHLSYKEKETEEQKAAKKQAIFDSLKKLSE